MEMRTDGARNQLYFLETNEFLEQKKKQTSHGLDKLEPDHKGGACEAEP